MTEVRIPVQIKLTPEEKAQKKKEARKAYMKEYMRTYNRERYHEKTKDTVSYHRGTYNSKCDKIEANKIKANIEKANIEKANTERIETEKIIITNKIEELENNMRLIIEKLKKESINPCPYKLKNLQFLFPKN
jgi:hypothetical protein